MLGGECVPAVEFADPASSCSHRWFSLTGSGFSNTNRSGIEGCNQIVLRLCA